jgi:excisionase family DNA binding protein
MTKRKEGLTIDFETLLVKPLLRINEVALLLDVTQRTLHKYLEDGRLTPVLDPAGRKRVRTEEVKRYLRHEVD